MNAGLDTLLAALIDKGRAHGVDPRIFVLLYLASIPPYLASMAWLVRRRVRREPILLPVVSTLGFFILPSAYIALFGRQLPLWTYALIGLLLLGGARSARRSVRSRVAASGAEIDGSG